MLIHRVYYELKPFIPRTLQIIVRRRMVLQKMKRSTNIWPINEEAKKRPGNWEGWPDGKRFAYVLMHDVDTGKGYDKCYELMDLEESRGFRSSFNLVPERYNISADLRQDLVRRGFEVAVHGLKHDGKLFLSKKGFRRQAIRINEYLKEWQCNGFVSPSMICRLDWIHELAIDYDTSTFDTDPFEPQPHGANTIFPFWVENCTSKGFVELPYTLPQDFTLFVLMKERNIDIWKKKLDWIVEKGGMALLITHPDYMNCKKGSCNIEEYPMDFYEKFLNYVKGKYEDQYWHVLPSEMARFWKGKMVIPQLPESTK
jgi:hypothetical protein